MKEYVLFFEEASIGFLGGELREEIRRIDSRGSLLLILQRAMEFAQMSPEERKQLISERGWKNDIKLKVKVGQRVESKKWGSGRIKEINPQLDTPIIFSPDKERNTGMSKGWHFVNNDAYYTWDGRVNPEDEEPDLFI